MFVSTYEIINQPLSHLFVQSIIDGFFLAKTLLWLPTQSHLHKIRSSSLFCLSCSQSVRALVYCLRILLEIPEVRLLLQHQGSKKIIVHLYWSRGLHGVNIQVSTELVNDFNKFSKERVSFFVCSCFKLHGNLHEVRTKTRLRDRQDTRAWGTTWLVVVQPFTGHVTFHDLSFLRHFKNSCKAVTVIGRNT